MPKNLPEHCFCLRENTKHRSQQINRLGTVSANSAVGTSTTYVRQRLGPLRGSNEGPHNPQSISNSERYPKAHNDR